MRREMILAVAAAVGLTACVERKPFRCTEASECVIGEARGLCYDGYCAYFDGECPAELRFEQNAGEGLGGECVEFVDETGCGEFCELYADVCGPSLPLWEDPDQCLRDCDFWPRGEEMGNTLECRYSAVLDAQLNDNPELCLNAAPSGGGACIDDGSPTCFQYCEVFVDRCEAQGDVPEEVTCEEACLPLRPGEWGDIAGNTIACRLAVLEDPELEDGVACNMAGFNDVEPCIDVE